MSKFAKRSVIIPAGVQVTESGRVIKVTGPKGGLERTLPREVDVKLGEGELMVISSQKVETKFGRAILGTIRSHVVNMITGVTQGWSKKLELNGTGYRAEVRGDELVLTVGLSHTLNFKAPQGVSFKIEKNVITVEGIDKDMVSQLAAKIRLSREPDPYKGKGIRYFGEILKLKPGKQAAKTAA